MGKEREVAAPIVLAAKEAGVRHMLYSTLPDVEQLSHGKWEVPHFTDKAKVCLSLGLPWTSVCPSHLVNVSCSRRQKATSVHHLYHADDRHHGKNCAIPSSDCASICLGVQVNFVVKEAKFETYTFIEPAFYYQNFEMFGLAKWSGDTMEFSLGCMGPDDILDAFDVNDTGGCNSRWLHAASLITEMRILLMAAKCQIGTQYPIVQVK
jgi:NmrA-like family